MAGSGWVKVHRKLKEHWIWQDAEFLKSWVDMLMRANHEGKKFLLNKDLVHCERGQFITSFNNLREAWGWGTSKTSRFLKMLENEKMIEVKSVRKYTTITICNYCTYQDRDKPNSTQTVRKQYANSTQTVPNNNYKELQEEENGTKRDNSKPELLDFQPDPTERKPTDQTAQGQDAILRELQRAYSIRITNNNRQEWRELLETHGRQAIQELLDFVEEEPERALEVYDLDRAAIWPNQIAEAFVIRKRNERAKT